MRRTTELGRLAQWLEHLVYTQGVGGSKPSAPNGVTQTSALTECTKTRMRNPPAATGGLSGNPLQGNQWGNSLGSLWRVLSCRRSGSEKASQPGISLSRKTGSKNRFGS